MRHGVSTVSSSSLLRQRIVNRLRENNGVMKKSTMVKLLSKQYGKQSIKREIINMECHRIVIVEHGDLRLNHHH